MTFRSWINEVWFEHVDEMLTWYNAQPPYTSSEYFNKYKWWLRREYRHRSLNTQEK